MPLRMRPVLLVASLLAVAACGDDGGDGDAGATGDGERPSIVVTTSILGDVVSNLVGDQAEVITIMEAGVDPHDFQASAQQADQMRRADLLVLNGAGFEAGMQDVISAAADDGVPTYEAISAVATLANDEHDHAEGEGDEHEHAEDEAHDHAEGEGEGDEHAEGEAHDHDHGPVDPHFFADPARMAEAVEGLAAHLASTVDGLDDAALERSAAAYAAQLRQLDEEVEATLDAIPAASRVLVTNHEVFGYFADRYGFEVVGAVIPSGTTADAASSQALADLADAVADAGVPAIFVDSSAADDLAQTVADEVGDVEVVPLFTESLGPDGSGGDHYLDMVRTNAQRIADALA